MVQHSMRQYPKYQTICDYAPTISHDMSVTHDIKRCETPMQKLQEIIAYGISAVRTTPAVCSRISLTENSPKNSLSYIQKLCYGRAFCFTFVGADSISARFYCGSIWNAPLRSRTVQFVKMSRPICFLPFLWYNTTNR